VPDFANMAHKKGAFQSSHSAYITFPIKRLVRGFLRQETRQQRSQVILFIVALSSASKRFHISHNFAIPQTVSALPHANRTYWALNFELRKSYFGSVPLLFKQIDI
jgi:hypothetical protein